ncbi:MAG: HEAT repeat domain-containing protein [Elusimicrobiota bacterium]|nr:HEAT repeat domain-containing protein [Elusimicrobiota bacterium]
MKKMLFICFAICAGLTGLLHGQEAGKPKALIAAFGVAERPSGTVEECRTAIAEGSPEEKEKAIAKLVSFGKDGFAALAELYTSADAGIRNATVSALTRNRQETAPLLMELLKDRDSRVRENAAGLLGRYWDIVPVPGLIEALKNDASRVRAKAAWTLGVKGTEAREAIPPLTEALSDGDSYVRENAAKALGEMGPAARDAVPALIKALEDTDKPVREKAIEALGKLGQEAGAAVPALAGSLTDPDPELRAKAAWALYNLGPAAGGAAAELADALGDKNREVRETAGRTLVLIGGSAAPPMIRLLADNDGGWGVTGAIETLGEIGRPAVPALAEALNSADARLRSRAMSALARIGRPATAALPELKILLKNADAGNRFNILEALWRIEPPPLAVVKEHLADQDPRIKHLAVSELGRRELGKEKIRLLLDALKDVDYIFVRSAAFSALGELGPEAIDAVPALTELLRSPSGFDRPDAAFTLGRIGPAAKEALPALKKALEDSDTFVRARAVRAIEEINSEEREINNAGD